jgi:hypothetical protein
MAEFIATRRFQIGGVPLSLALDDAASFLPLRASYRPYLHSAAGITAEPTEPIAVRGSVGSLPAWVQGLDRDVLYAPDGFWSAHRAQDRLVFACREPGGDSDGIWRVLIGDRAGTRWEIVTSPCPRFLAARMAQDARVPDPLVFPAAELILLNYLSTRSGALLHACGVVDDDGRGYLFCGRSGAGKSTVAGVWDDPGTVLNDDRTLLRRTDAHGFRIHGTPWHGDFSRTDPRSAPLCGVFFLKQAPRHGFERVCVESAHRQLLTSWWLPLWDKSAGLLQTLALCSRVAHDVPAFELSFRPDRTLCDTVRRAIASVGAPLREPLERTCP